MSDTPRTDDLFKKYMIVPPNVLAEHARQLERDLRITTHMCSQLAHLAGLPRQVFPDDIEPSAEAVAAAVMAFQESTQHIHLNITTAKFVIGMIAALKAAYKQGK